MKNFFRILAVALAFSVAFSSCSKEQDDEITNTITLRGSTLTINMALYAKY